jgi:hypothetical protein
MKIEKILDEAKKKDYSVISKEELHDILLSSEIIVEKDTLISDKIRLLKFQNELLIQEKSNKDEFLIRIMKSNKEAENFIKNRMETYDKMWDGCGCKVEYYT